MWIHDSAQSLPPPALHWHLTILMITAMISATTTISLTFDTMTSATTPQQQNPLHHPEQRHDDGSCLHRCNFGYHHHFTIFTNDSDHGCDSVTTTTMTQWQWQWQLLLSPPWSRPPWPWTLLPWNIDDDDIGLPHIVQISLMYINYKVQYIYYPAIIEYIARLYYTSARWQLVLTHLQHLNCLEPDS